MSVFRDIMRTLVLEKVRYVIVGGVAVVLHGHDISQLEALERLRGKATE